MCGCVGGYFRRFRMGVFGEVTLGTLHVFVSGPNPKTDTPTQVLKKTKNVIFISFM